MHLTLNMFTLTDAVCESLSLSRDLDRSTGTCFRSDVLCIFTLHQCCICMKKLYVCVDGLLVILHMDVLWLCLTTDGQLISVNRNFQSTRHLRYGLLYPGR